MSNGLDQIICKKKKNPTKEKNVTRNESHVS